MSEKRYYTFARAKRLVSIIPANLSDQKLIKHRVLLRDYVRAHSSALYRRELIEGGFYRNATTASSSGLVPKDMHLHTNLVNALEETESEFSKRGFADPPLTTTTEVRRRKSNSLPNMIWIFRAKNIGFARYPENGQLSNARKRG